MESGTQPATEKPLNAFLRALTNKRVPHIIAVVGIIVSCIVFYLVNALHTNAIKKEFRHLSDIQGQVFTSLLKDYIHSFESIRSLYYSSEYVSQSEFKEFSSFLDHRPAFKFVRWVELDQNQKAKEEFIHGEDDLKLTLDQLPKFSTVPETGLWLSFPVSDEYNQTIFLLPVVKDNGPRGMIYMGIDLPTLFNEEIHWEAQPDYFAVFSKKNYSQLLYFQQNSHSNKHLIHTFSSFDALSNKIKNYETYDIDFLGSDIRLVFIPAYSHRPKLVYIDSLLSFIFCLLLTASFVAVAHILVSEKTRVEKEVERQTAVILKNKKDLNESESRYHMSLAASSVGLWDWDIEKHTMYWSKGYKNILSIKDNSFTPTVEDYNRRIHPDDVDKIHKAYSDTAHDNQDYELEYRLLDDNKNYVWVLSRANIVRDTTGKATRIAGSIDDITERKRYELQLYDANKFQQLIFDSNPLGIFVKDEEFKIVMANKNFINMYPKESQDKIIGYTTLEKYPDDEVHTFLAMDRMAFEKGYSRTNETITTPIGKTITFDTQKIRFENSSGQKFILGVSADITEKEALINKLVDSNQELERFAYICSHDLQEPLRMVRSFTEKLESHFKSQLINDDKGKKYLNFVLDGAVRAQQLVTEILEYSKIDQDTLKRDDVNLNELVHSIASNIQNNALATNTVSPEIIFNNLPTIKGNKTQLLQLFQNLINNGVKYQIEGKQPKIILKAVKDKSNWKISVSDNGIGIEPQHLTKIFDIFKRLHRKDQYAGTGIGLAICKKVVQRHHGKIMVDSEINKGSIFTVVLPT